MKIVVILGSHRKGNTLKLVNQVEETMQLLGNVEFTYLHLRDLNLKNCKGCFQCIQKGSDICPLKDDKYLILQTLLNSDGVILATPAYNFNVSTIMKNFIDRFAHLGHQPKLFNQHVLLLSTTAGTGAAEVISYLNKYVGRLWGFRTITSLKILTPPYEKSIKLKNNDIQKINNISKIFFNKIQTNNFHLNYYHIEQFCSLRAIFSMEKMKNAFPADYELYNSLNNKKYYYDIKVNALKYLIALIQANLLKLLISTTFEKE